jgi:glycosyltransferase involved in cell wall biosynthesis
MERPLGLCGQKSKRFIYPYLFMKDNPEITVIILTYNRAQYVGRAVRSVQAQTFRDFELILIDNGSTDNGNTGAVCRELVREYPAIRFIRRENSTIGAGRNAGLDLARGRYIAFIDDDDYAYPDMLAFLYRLIIDHQADISFCGSDKEVEGKVVPQFVFDDVLVLPPEEAVIELLERQKLNIATPTKLFRADLFKTLRFSETTKYDDISMTYKLFAAAGKIVAHGVPQYCFVRHGENNSAFTNKDTLITPEQLEAYFEVYRERTTWLLEKLPAIAGYINYSEWSFLLSMYRKIVVNKLKNCAAQKAYCEVYLREAGDRYVGSPWIKGFEREWISCKSLNY